MFGDRDPVAKLVLLNTRPQRVFCKKEESEGKILEKNPGRQTSKPSDTAEDLMEHFEPPFCSQALSFLHLINAAGLKLCCRYIQKLVFSPLLMVATNDAMFGAASMLLTSFLF